MDAQLKKDIMDHYHGLYKQRALAEKPGLMGKWLRWHENKEQQWATTQGASFTVVLITGAMLGAIILIPVTTIALIPLLAAPAYLVGLVMGTSTVETSSNKAMEKDLESGLLAARYRTEVTHKKLESLPALREEKLREIDQTAATLKNEAQQLTDHISKTYFNTAAAPAAGKLPSAAKTAAPEAPKAG